MPPIKCPSCNGTNFELLNERDCKCLSCGNILNNQTIRVKNPGDRANGGLAFLSFLIPILGFILCGVNNRKKPHASGTYLKCAIWGIVVPLILLAIYYAIIFFYVGSALSSLPY